MVKKIGSPEDHLLSCEVLKSANQSPQIAKLTGKVRTLQNSLPLMKHNHLTPHPSLPQNAGSMIFEEQHFLSEGPFEDPFRVKAKLPPLEQMWHGFYELIEVVNNLSLLVESVEAVSDIHVLSVLAVWGQTPSTRLGLISKDLVVNCQDPFLSHCLNWMKSGQIDSYIDPMISALPGSHKIWEVTHAVKQDRIPFLIDLPFAQLIFSIGQSQHLISKFNITQPKLAPISLSPIFSSQDLEKHRASLHGHKLALDKILITQYLQKSRLATHLDFIKRSMMMARGDFVDTLLTKMGPMLDKPAQEVYFHNIMPLFDDEVRKANLHPPGTQASDILGRLGIKLLEASPGDTGWDVVCADFQCPPLLQYLFPPELTLCLMRLWHHLFKLKRNLAKINEVWLTQRTIFKLLPQGSLFYRLLVKCNLVRTHMTQFLQNLTSYIFLEVIESRITEYLRSLATQTSLQQLQEATRKLMLTILEESFIGRDQHNLYKSVSDLISYVTRFWKAFGIIQKYCLKQDDPDSPPTLNQDFPLAKSAKMIDGIWTAYSDVYTRFLLRLEENPDTRNTAFKFDFNEFHISSHEEKLTKIYREEMNKPPPPSFD